jgi:hypothetical protein
MDWIKVSLIVALVVLFAVLWTRSKVNIHMEPMENQRTSQVNPKEALEKVNKMVTDAQDGINLSTYHGDLQDLVLQWDKWGGLRMLALLKDTTNIQKNMVEFNKLAEFKNNLNVALATLDKS